MNYWLFQGNPKYYRITDAIRELQEIPWRVTNHWVSIALGDHILIWVSGAEAGIYALGEISDAPRFRQDVPDKAYWVGGIEKASEDERKTTVRLTDKLLNRPILKRNILNDQVLNDLLVLRAPNRTNYKITEQDWKRVQELIKEG